MQTTHWGATVAAAPASTPATAPPPVDLRRDGLAFEQLVLRLLDESSWDGRARIGGQRTKDVLRRSADRQANLAGVGAALAALARHPQADRRARLAVIFEELQAWAEAMGATDPCLVTVATHEAREDGEADAALLAVLGTLPDRAKLERALRECAEQITARRRVMVALRVRLARLMAPRGGLPA